MYQNQFINHWVHSGDVNFPSKYGIVREYFLPDKKIEIYDYISEYVLKYSTLPSFTSLAREHKGFTHYEKDSLETIESVVFRVRDEWFNEQLSKNLSKLVDDAEGGNSVESYIKYREECNAKLDSLNMSFNFYSWINTPEARLAKYMERHGKEGLVGYSTGLSKMDDLTGGIQLDDFILISGRTGQGKSLLGDYIGLSVWKHCISADIRNPILCINTEMTATSVAYRLDTLKAHFPNSALRLGKLPEVDEYENYLNVLSENKTDYIIATSEALGRNFTPMDVQLLIDRYKPVLVIVDQLYDFYDGTGERDIRKRIISVTNSLRNINLKSKTPFIVMAQAGREAAREAKKDIKATPEIHQIQESDNPAQKSTKVFTLKMSGDIMTIALKKNRDGKKDEEIHFKLNIDSGIWEETEDVVLHF